MPGSTYEPPPLEVWLTLSLGLTVLNPYYRGFARSLNLRGNERVLDFGSGSGICSRHIAARLQQGGHLACTDISHGWMKVIRRTLRRFDNVSFHRGYLCELRLLEESFDVVVVHFVLHDMPVAEIQETLGCLARLLKPGGRLVAREPQGEGLTLDELNGYAAAVKLNPNPLTAHKIATGAVYDACFNR